MPTRIEKYQAYRQEIANDSLLIDHTKIQSASASRYRKLIEEINPAILKGLEIEINYPTIYSQTENSNFQNLDSFDQLITKLDTKTLQAINQEIANVNQTQLESVLNKKNQLKESWLIQNQDYLTLKNSKNKLQKIKNQINDFEISSNLSIEKMQAILSKKQTIPSIEILKPEVYSTKNKLKDYSKVSLIIAIIILLTIFLVTTYIIVELILT